MPAIWSSAPTVRLKLLLVELKNQVTGCQWGRGPTPLQCARPSQDRINENAADLKIERIGAKDDRPAPLTAEKIERGLMGAAMFVQGSATLFENWSESFLPTLNELPPADQAYCPINWRRPQYLLLSQRLAVGR